ncbi:uncharacterized protein EAE97_004136 [Botrytis byssoidea]|uniref:AB hydrolase-1 domain-containing protein n=1 Tax=Botrytis byssoidea TaxID=139641 RepID=A0A9P5IPS4_9HELO|nr:uncharacterized protein EAE97_004136 [Botrytis byssoidea]KAF7946887.1 hypothetical protein EAE97_004136 [Botrytis byssoidea]
MPRPPPPLSTPVFILVPGASQSPAHYDLLMHLLLTRGHPVYSAILPSTGPGNAKNVTAQVDAEYVREHMLLPILDTEGHDVVMVMHSYRCFEETRGKKATEYVDHRGREMNKKADTNSPQKRYPRQRRRIRTRQKRSRSSGKKTSVLGQIYIASLLVKGGDGGNIVDALGGLLPPHITPDEPSGILTCADPGPPLYSDVTPIVFQNAIVNSTLCPSYASWHSPCPRASWDQESFKGKIAFIRTLNDTGIPLQFQDMFMQNTGEEWIVKDMNTGHSPQLGQPERVCDVLIELARGFGGV